MIRNLRGRTPFTSLLLIFLINFTSSVIADDMSMRLNAIYAMPPKTMAATGTFTAGAWNQVLQHARSIENTDLRELVLEMILEPESEAFDQPARQSFATAPGGTSGHHVYPGGLAVHTLELLEVALAWADARERIYGVEFDRDIIIAALVLHDWGKIWYRFDTARGVVSIPDWWPAAWGTEGRWPWMGGHGAVVYAELIVREAPPELIAGAAAAHFDPAWHLSGPAEGLNAALAEAAKIAGRPAPVINRRERMAEWWFSTFTDTAFSFPSEVAPPIAQQAIDAVVEKLGVQAGSREATLLSWYVLTRVSDLQLYAAYQRAGFQLGAAEDLVSATLRASR